MIKAFDAHETNFSGNGLGIVSASSCLVEEIRNGMYHATVEVPITTPEKLERLAAGNYLSDPCPIRPLPNFTQYERINDTHWSVWRSKYSVTNAEICEKPVIGGLVEFYTGTLTRIDDFVYNNYRIKVRTGDNRTVYVRYSDIQNIADIGEWVTVGDDEFWYTKPNVLKEQLFKVYDRIEDTTSLFIRVEADHVSYELDRAVSNVGVVESFPLPAMVQKDINGLYTREHNPFVFMAYKFYPNDMQDKESKLWSKSELTYLFDEKYGFAKQFGVTVLRDNFNIFLLDNDDIAASETIIRSHKDIDGVEYEYDESEVVTRVLPVGVGKGRGGSDVYLDEVYIDSENADQFSFVSSKVFEYTSDEAATKSGLLSLANREFDENHIDRPKHHVSIDFFQLRDTEFSKLRDNVYIGNTVKIIDKIIGRTIESQLSRYVWDGLPTQMRYKEIEIGDLINLV